MVILRLLLSVLKHEDVDSEMTWYIADTENTIIEIDLFNKFQYMFFHIFLIVSIKCF